MPRDDWEKARRKDAARKPVVTDSKARSYVASAPISDPVVRCPRCGANVPPQSLKRHVKKRCISKTAPDEFKKRILGSDKVWSRISLQKGAERITGMKVSLNKIADGRWQWSIRLREIEIAIGLADTIFAAKLEAMNAILKRRDCYSRLVRFVRTTE